MAGPGKTIRRALISVFDKTGVAEFARTLHDEFGIEIISTGGTARTLRGAGIPVTLVEQITGFPEMLDGRVKTLHPRIHAAILADRDNPQHVQQLQAQGIEPIDLVVVNLYPFERTVAEPGCTLQQAVEMIDIGGPCMLRAAAKNHRHVWVVCDSADWPRVVENLRRVDLDDDHWRAIRAGAAALAFKQTCRYDRAVAAYLAEHESLSVFDRVLEMASRAKLRYGENPHQAAELLQVSGEIVAFAEIDGAEVEVSFNNYLDATAALELCAELSRAGEGSPLGPRPAVCFIKHTNACGAAVVSPADDSPVALEAARIEAYRKAYLGDPNAAMGGILAVNFRVNAAFAATVLETYRRWGKPLKDAGAPYAPGGFFVEVWIAPGFDPEAVRLIRGELAPSADMPDPPRKDWGRRVRLLDVGDVQAAAASQGAEYRRIAGGMLMQDDDWLGLNESEWRVVTERGPSERELEDLRLAWLVCKHTKSNAITICLNGMLIGNGAGQMSRVMSCRVATWAARENGHLSDGGGDQAAGSGGAVAASDAFFPFRDGPDILIGAGVTALIQPGGSKRDEDTIRACDEHGVAMIFTGARHFKH